MALNPRQQRFVAEYLLDPNATQAAIKAGYSKKTAAETGYENLRKPQIAAAIAEAQAARANRVKMAADWVLEQLKIEALDRSGAASPSARVRAIELIGKHLGMFAERHQHQHSGPDGGPIRVDLARLTDGQLDELDQLLTAAEVPVESGQVAD